MSKQARATALAQKTPEGSPHPNRVFLRTYAGGSLPGSDEHTIDHRDKPFSLRDMQRWPELSIIPPLTQNTIRSTGQDPASNANLLKKPPAGKNASAGKPSISHDFSQVRVQSSTAPTLQTKMAVNQPGDQYEQEAEQVADNVLRMAAPGTLMAPAAPNDDKPEDETLLRKERNSAGVSTVPGLPPIVNEVLSSGDGQPLDSTTRTFMEQRFGHDFSRVRIHTSEQASASAHAVNALAYTVGRDVIFEREQYAPETEAGKWLLAHELTHVVQQREAPGLQEFAKKTATDRSSYGAELVSVRERTETPLVQREEGEPGLAESLWSGVKAVGGAVVSGAERVGEAAASGAEAIGGAVVSGAEKVGEAALEFSEELVWDLLNRFAPEFVPILRKGVGVWLEEKITSVVEYAFNTLSAPVSEIAGVIESLSEHFSKLVAWMQDAVTKIMQGDMNAISEAAEKIQQVIDGISSPIVSHVKQVIKHVADGFNLLWTRFGEPAWNFLQHIGGQAWEIILRFGTTLWNKIVSIREASSKAWAWIMNKLGLGQGEESQNGLLQWIQKKASAIWDQIKTNIGPFMKTLSKVGDALAMLSPAGPFIALGAGVGKLIEGIRWIRQNWNSPDLVIRMREHLYNIMIPGIMNAIDGVKSALTRGTSFITGKLHDIMSGLGQMMAALGASVLKFATSTVKWITDHFRALILWAEKELPAFVNKVNGGLERLGALLRPVWQILGAIITFVLNPFEALSDLLLALLWLFLSPDLKTRIINFILDVLIIAARVSGFISAFMADITGLGSLVTLLETAILGFLQRLRAYPRNDKGEDDRINILDRFAKIMVEGNVEYTKGFLLGLVLGVWDGISGPFILIWDIIKIIGGLFKFLWRTVKAMAKPETYSAMLRGLESAWNTLKTKIEPAIEELLSGKSDPMKIIDIIRSLIESAFQAVKGVGASMADALITSIKNAKDRELGEAVGRILGNIVFEVILVVATDGIYAARKAIGLLAEEIAGEVAGLIGEILENFPKVLSLIEKIGEFASNNRAMRAIIDAVKSLLRGIIRFIEISYGIESAEERAAKDAERALSKGERLASDVRREAKVVDEVTGEAHELKLLEDGSLVRCSDECLKIVDSVSDRAAQLSKGLDAASELRRQASELTDKAKGIAQELTKAAALPEAERAAREAVLMKEAELLEKEMQTLEHLPSKIADPAQLERLLNLSDDPAQLDRLLNLVKGNAADLERFLNMAGGKGQAARLENLMNLAVGKDPARVEALLQLANGNSAEFERLADAAHRFKQQPVGSLPRPGNLYGFSDADMAHFPERHTYDFFDFGAAINAPNTTMWPPGTTPQNLEGFLQEALDKLASKGDLPILAKPQKVITLGNGVEVQVGVRLSKTVPGAVEIGQFFPTRASNPTFDNFSKAVMRAFQKIFKP